MNAKTDGFCIGVNRRRGLVRLACLAVLALGAGMLLASTQGLGFARSVTPGLVERYAARFGPDSRTRISAWQQFVGSIAPERQQTSNGELGFLGPVNVFFNRLPYADDLVHWGVKDYWATPAEMIASDGGDCEDYSIAKYFALKEMGVPIERLRMTYVKAVRLNQAHMVLAYYARPDAEPLILDNFEDQVEPASKRIDLIPVFSFNDEDLLLARQRQSSVRAGSTLQIRLWRELVGRLEQELRM